MKFTHHAFTSLVIAVAVWLSLVPLSPMVSPTDSIQVEALFILGPAALVGLILGLLKSPRALTLLVQLFTILGALVWRGLKLAGPGEPVVVLRALTTAGVELIRDGIPPLPPEPGVVWLCLVLTAVIVIVVELLVEGLEQPAWAIVPLAVTYGTSAVIIAEDLDWLMVVPVLAGYVAILLSTTGMAEAAGKASRAASHHASRITVGTAFAAAALIVAVIASTAVPTGDKRPWTEAGPSGPIQLSDPTVRLDQDLRRPTDSPVLTYRTNTGQPVYLRTVALPTLSAAGAGLLPMSLNRTGLERAYTFPGDTVEVEIQMAAVPSEYLPAPFAVNSFDAAGTWSFDPDTMAIVAAGSDRTAQTVNLSYSVESVLPSPSREDIMNAEAGGGLDAVTREVPSSLSPNVAALTAEVVAGATTAGEKALAIQQFLRSDAFRYTLQAPNSAGTDAVSTFLTEARAGYCIHFAAAMITMARLEGIDARMAVGFVPGQRQEDGSYSVTSHDAHAWPELYLDGLGWVPFEPTPAYAGDPEYVDPSAMQPEPTAPVSPTPPATSAPVPTSIPEPEQPEQPAPTPLEGGDDGIGAVIAWALLALFVAALPSLVRVGVRSVRLRGSADPSVAADGAWREVESLFMDYALAWPEGSPGPVGLKAAEALPEDGAENLRRVGRAVERSRFAQTGAEVADLPGQVRAVRRSLAEQATRSKRLRATFLPSSLWRAGR